MGAVLSHPADDNVADWSAENGTSASARIGEVLGDGWTQAGAAVGTYVVGLAAGHRQTTHVGSDLIRAQFLNAVFTRGLKIIVDRKRPSGGGHSLPSGHSSAAFTTAGVLHGHFGWRVGVPAYAVASYVGWTRVRDRSHWLSDVIIGGTIGTIIGRTVTAGHRERSWTVVPAVSRTSAGVYLTKR
jgi:membrane-associated phospholipid phosphatase